MAVDLSTNKALYHANGSYAVLVTEERKETCKESIWPADFAKDEKDDLEEDKYAVEDCPERACGAAGEMSNLDAMRTVERLNQPIWNGRVSVPRA